MDQEAKTQYLFDVQFVPWAPCTVDSTGHGLKFSRGLGQELSWSRWFCKGHWRTGGVHISWTACCEIPFPCRWMTYHQMLSGTWFLNEEFLISRFNQILLCHKASRWFLLGFAAHIDIDSKCRAKANRALSKTEKCDIFRCCHVTSVGATRAWCRAWVKHQRWGLKG